MKIASDPQMGFQAIHHHVTTSQEALIKRIDEVAEEFIDPEYTNEPTT